MLHRNGLKEGSKSSGLVFIVILSGLEYLLGQAPTLGFIIGVYSGCEDPELIWFCSSYFIPSQ